MCKKFVYVKLYNSGKCEWVYSVCRCDLRENHAGPCRAIADAIKKAESNEEAMEKLKVDIRLKGVWYG